MKTRKENFGSIPTGLLQSIVQLQGKIKFEKEEELALGVHEYTF